MKKIRSIIEQTSLGKAFVVTTAVFIAIHVVYFFFILLFGLWDGNVLSVSEALLDNILNNKGKLAAIYLGVIAALALVISNN